MICQNCGTQNADNSKFCIKCGFPLNVNNVPSNNQQMNPYQESYGNMNPQPMNANMNINNIPQNANQTIQNTNQKENIKINLIEYFMILFEILLKPFTALKEKINKFDSFKNSAILSIMVSLLASLITLIKTIISTVRVTSGGLFTETKTEWVWENLKKIEFIKVIGKNWLIFLVIIFAIACLYYIAGAIIKKQLNFSKILGISAISIVPLLFALLLSPILAIIYAPLGMIITIIGAVYSLIIIYETINNEILLEGDIKYYFNFICLSILFIAGYYVYMKFFTTSVGNKLNDIFNMFG